MFVVLVDVDDDVAICLMRRLIFYNERLLLRGGFRNCLEFENAPRNDVLKASRAIWLMRRLIFYNERLLRRGEFRIILKYVNAPRNDVLDYFTSLRGTVIDVVV
jgi:hypothetical protein